MAQHVSHSFRHPPAVLIAALCSIVVCLPSQSTRGQVPPGCFSSGSGPVINVAPHRAHIGDTIRITALGFQLGGSSCLLTNGQCDIVYPNGTFQTYETNFNTSSQGELLLCVSNGIPTSIPPGPDPGCSPVTLTYVVQASDINNSPSHTMNLCGGSIFASLTGTSNQIKFFAIGGGCETGTGGGLSSAGTGNDAVTIFDPPHITVTKQCVINCPPTNSAVYGSPIHFTGTICNTSTGGTPQTGGNTLTNVFVVDMPAATITYSNLSHMGVPFPTVGGGALLQGDCVDYYGSYTPANLCGPDTDTIVATGTDTIAPVQTVHATNSATCFVCTAPAITVTKLCPNTNGIPGGVLGFSGQVCNAGNVPLTNVTVVDNQSLSGGGFVVASYPLLTNGECRTFFASIVVPINVCSITDTLTAMGTSVCGCLVTNNASATCQINCAPVVQTVLLSNAVTTIIWTAVPGQRYRVQYKSDLNPSTAWSNLLDVTASGPMATNQDNTLGTADQRFYRVVVMP